METSKSPFLNTTNSVLNVNERDPTERIESLPEIKMNIFFCVKYRNNQKLSSHNWFFNGFCK